MTTDYVLIEGDLDEILEYNIEQASRRDYEFHNDIVRIKNDHQDYGCYLCQLTGSEQERYFRMKASDLQIYIDWANKPVYVEDVCKYI